jgi:hypothetical protein
MSINKKPKNAKKQKRDKIGALLKTKLSQDCGPKIVGRQWRRDS